MRFLVTTSFVRVAVVLAVLSIAVHNSQAVEPGAVQRMESPDQVPEGLAPSDWSSIRGAYEANRHKAHPVAGKPGVWRARNPGQRWSIEFDSRGFLASPDAGGWQWGLRLKGHGFPGAHRAISGPPQTTETHYGHVSYRWGANLEEWHKNDRRGLEHGYAVHARPEGGEGPLEFDLAVRGGLTPKVSDNGRDVRFLNDQGATTVNYSGLTVWDADGRELPARFEKRPNGLLLAVDEAGARYPLTIDPVAQQAYLKASNTGAGDGFGSSVAVSDDTVVVGAFLETSSATGVNGDGSDNTMSAAGAAYVFVRDNTGAWSQQAYLKASNTTRDAYFGGTVSISGDTIVVGAAGEASNATGVNGNETNTSAANAGAAYVYVRDGMGAWTQQAYLKASNTEAGDLFGGNVAVSGDTIIVAARSEDSTARGVNGNEADNSASGAGAAYVFVRDGTGAWTQQAYLKASNAEAGDTFGFSVAISDDTAVVGAHGEAGSATGVNGDESDNNASGASAACVFVRDDSGMWSQQAYLKASNAKAFDQFGVSVSISGDTVVVGAPGEDSSALGSGAAYVFARDGANVWSQQSHLKASNPDQGDQFGFSVAVSNGAIVVGAFFEGGSSTGVNGDESDNGAGSSGAAYVFKSDGSGMWSQQAYLKASNSGAGDWFGRSVSISGDTVVVGSQAESGNATGVGGDGTDNSAGNSGAAYIYEGVGGDAGGMTVTQLTQQAYLKASNVGKHDQFGWSVSISGDTLIVGAVNEGSSATGVNGNQRSNDASISGAAYVFVRNSAGVWTQQAYLKASNDEQLDRFGYSVAVSGDTAVVGAWSEASNATGVNGNEGDNSATNSGAAYVFVRNSAGVWMQQAYLKASNTEADDSFGLAVSISGDTVVVGALGEGGASSGINGNDADNSASASGAAYVFVRDNVGTWTQQAYLKASNPERGDLFGAAVSVSDDTVVVGARSEGSASTGVNGDESDNSASVSGAVYVFKRDQGVWAQQAYLKASNTEQSDFFGRAVSVSGNTIVVGAEGDDSNATGVNGDDSDNSASYSGAAYVFTRDASGSWGQHAYLKASNSRRRHFFGLSVAVADDTVVVGAQEEDGRSAGVNGDESSRGLTGSGAAYVFTEMVVPDGPTKPTLGEVGVVAAGSLDRQSGLFIQMARVDNPTGSAIARLRVTATLSAAELAAGIRLYNATGVDAMGRGYVDHDAVVPANGSVTLRLEYYIPDRTTLPSPTLSVEIVPAAARPEISGTNFAIDRRHMRADSPFVIDFMTEQGGVYHIQYSEDMTTWHTVRSPIQGTGARVQWIDNGPPKTRSFPEGPSAMRMYRVLRKNSN